MDDDLNFGDTNGFDLLDDKPLEFECDEKDEKVDVTTLRSRIMLLNKVPSLMSMSMPPITASLSMPSASLSLSVAEADNTLNETVVATKTPSKLPRPSPGSTRNKPLHALYPTRLPIPGSSNKHMSSSVVKHRSALTESSSNEIFERKLAEVLDMDQALAFAPSTLRKEKPAEENVVHSGYTPVKKAPIPEDEEAFVVTKKMVF